MAALAIGAFEAIPSLSLAASVLTLAHDFSTNDSAGRDVDCVSLLVFVLTNRLAIEFTVAVVLNGQILGNTT